MRIWSLHPEYLDAKGLIALWRETLLARHVLAGKTRGYLNHPQLIRFRAAAHPVSLIDQYLIPVYDEAVKRGYHFSREKIGRPFESVKLSVTRGQLLYEREHLLNKLKIRDEDKFCKLTTIALPEPHPLFDMVDGSIEGWERIKDKPLTQ